MDPQPSDELREGLDLIKHEKDWIGGGGDFARKANGTGCYPWDPDAITFCAFGAVTRTSNGRFGPNSQTRAMRYLYEAAVALGFDSPFTVNTISHAVVLGMYTRAIEMADMDEANAAAQEFLRKNQEFPPLKP
jgi:hypothetical protein